MPEKHEYSEWKKKEVEIRATQNCQMLRFKIFKCFFFVREVFQQFLVTICLHFNFSRGS